VDWVLARISALRAENQLAPLEEKERTVITNAVRFARAQVSPVASFWGGIVSQEVVKFTGKYTPLRQWLHHEFSEALPKEPVDRRLQNSRYDDFVAVFGRELLERLSEQK